MLARFGKPVDDRIGREEVTVNLEPSCPLKALAAVAAIIALAFQLGLAGPARGHDRTAAHAKAADRPPPLVQVVGRTPGG